MLEGIGCPKGGVGTCIVAEKRGCVEWVVAVVVAGGRFDWV